MGSQQKNNVPDVFAIAAELQSQLETRVAKALANSGRQEQSPVSTKSFAVKTNAQKTILNIVKQGLGATLNDLGHLKLERPTVSIIILAFNKIEYTLDCLESLSRQATHYNFEVILLDNHSNDTTPQMAGIIPGLRYFRNPKNQGFVEGNNTAVKHARGEIIVLLNNDTRVLGNWLDALVDRLMSDASIGLVGSKLIYPNGQLQEAGGIIFNDATGHNFGKNKKANNFEYNYCREVDYCSGASMAFWRKDFDRLGGFDRLYAPAYYEDTDLAMSIRHRLGKRVIYEPLSVLVHIEGGTAGVDSTSGFKRYQTINKTKFYKKWRKELSDEHYEPHTNPLVAARYGKRTRILVVDAIVPEYNSDAGSFRMFQILKGLTKLNYDVTFYTDNLVATQPYTGELQALGVEVVYGGEQTLQDFHKQRLNTYSVVILSRPIIAIWHLEYCKAYQPKARLIYDTVDLHYLRIARQAETENNLELKTEAAKWQQLEYFLMDNTDSTLVVSYDEQKLLKKTKPNVNVRVLSSINTPPPPSAKPIDFKKRHGLLFIGSSHPPNQDAILWFCEYILPIIQKQIPTVELTLLGSNPNDTIKNLSNEYIHVPGYIEDVSSYFCQAKVFVCPMRFGAGVKGKIVQSLAFGLPVVTTAIGAEGIHIENEKSCLKAETPKDFANQVIRLYNDPELWEKIRKNSQLVYDQYFSEAAGLKAINDALQ